MKITEKREYNHAIGKKCDICGKEIKVNSFNDMIEIEWYCPMLERTCEAKGTMDVCSTKCFIKGIKKIKEWWSIVKSIKNCDAFTDTIDDIDINHI